MTLTNLDFGDFEADDAFDHAPPDPFQVAMRIHRIRRYLSQLAGDDIGDFFAMSEDEQAHAITVGEDIVAWVITHDPNQKAQLARIIHESRAYQEQLPPWAALDPTRRAIAEAIAKVLGDWLIREGAWQ
jgi:hypothetical protein